MNKIFTRQSSDTGRVKTLPHQSEHTRFRGYLSVERATIEIENTGQQFNITNNINITSNISMLVILIIQMLLVILVMLVFILFKHF